MNEGIEENIMLQKEVLFPVIQLVRSIQNVKEAYEG
jgi:hypothetical protein